MESWRFSNYSVYAFICLSRNFVRLLSISSLHIVCFSYVLRMISKIIFRGIVCFLVILVILLNCCLTLLKVYLRLGTHLGYRQEWWCSTTHYHSLSSRFYHGCSRYIYRKRRWKSLKHKRSMISCILSKWTGSKRPFRWIRCDYSTRKFSLPRL